MSAPKPHAASSPQHPRKLDGLFRPRSVAIVGASRKKGHLARELLHNLIVHEFQGAIYPVNPQAQVIHSIQAYPSVSAIPYEVDLAIIVVPRDHVLAAAEDCGKKGVKGIVVISSGFREVGPHGVEREKQLVGICRKYGMRMIGPNCMGILNTDPAFQLAGTFAGTFPRRGPIGFLSQSGALGAALLSHADTLGLGMTMFASMGNKADVSGNDLLEYWEEDPDTKVVLMYLESFGNPRKFTQIARRVTKRMPVVAVKAGRTAAGAAAAASHTGALAGSDRAADALFSQCGVIRAQTVNELFDIAMAFSSQPLPKGRRVAILTDAGGPAIMATDALVAAGLEMATLAPETMKELAKGLSEDASVRNPVDMLGHSGGPDYARCLPILLADPGVDAAIALYVPPVMHDPVEVAQCIFGAAQGSEKPVLCVLMAHQQVLEAVKRSGGPSLPVYGFPEAAARALAAMVRYREMRDRDPGRVPELQVDRATAEKVFRKAAKEGREHLSLDEAQKVLAAYGIRFAKSRLAATKDELRAAFRAVGAPAVLKISSPDIVHKTEIGGVITNVGSHEEAAVAYDALVHRAHKAFPQARIDGVLVQEMVRGGREMILGMTTDRSFGPLLMAGLGGIYVEVMKDVSFRVHPITDVDARDMIEGLRAAPLLRGVRGEKAMSIDAYADALLRVSRLISDFHGIRELDVNPFVVGETAEESVAVDARIRIDPKEYA